MSEASQLKLRQALAALAKRREDEAAWADVYSALAPRAAATAYRLLGGDRAAAQDACHDAFLRLLRSADFEKLADEEELGRYFSVIVRNVCLDALRLRSKSESVSLDGKPGVLGGEASEPGSFAEQEDGIAQVEFVELEQHLADSMSKAAPPERILISLLRKGYTLSEVAARLGVSYENAGVRVHRLRLKLREWRDGLQN